MMNAARIAIVIHADQLDFTYSLVNVGIFSGLEIWFGVIAACVPTLGPLFVRGAGRPSYANSPGGRNAIWRGYAGSRAKAARVGLVGEPETIGGGAVGGSGSAGHSSSAGSGGSTVKGWKFLKSAGRSGNREEQSRGLSTLGSTAVDDGERDGVGAHPGGGYGGRARENDEIPLRERGEGYSHSYGVGPGPDVDADGWSGHSSREGARPIGGVGYATVTPPPPPTQTQAQTRAGSDPHRNVVNVRTDVSTEYWRPPHGV